MSGSHLILRGDARRIPLVAGSVDLIVTSPPYWAQRSYRDAGAHFNGQLGSEPHPRHWLDAMYEVMKECWRVLAPCGSVFVNLGDKRAGSGGGNDNTGLGFKRGTQTDATDNRGNPRRYQQAHFGRRKSRQLLPERFAIGCEDGLADPEGIGWIVRQVIVWQKANGLPESVTDRTRDDFEYIYHLVKSDRYFAAVDEIREPLAAKTLTHRGNGKAWGNDENPDNNCGNGGERRPDPRGALPGSVWRIASEPLRIPDYFVHDDRGWRMWGDKPYGKPRKLKDEEAPEGLFALSDVPAGMKVIPELVGLWRYVERRLAEGYEGPIMVGWVDHFAAFPTEIPRRLILGFNPSGICTACNEPRRPVVEKRLRHKQFVTPEHRDRMSKSVTEGRSGRADYYDELGSTEAPITGYACRCPDTSAPTRNAIVFDPFGGTGTTALVAETLDRTGISLDLSADYCNLARWRIEESGHGAKAEQRTWGEAQGTLL